MNTTMNGKKIQAVEVTQADGNPRRYSPGLMYYPDLRTPSGPLIRSIELSATHHGDHDQFWVVLRTDDEIEIARFNARSPYTHNITWDWGE